MISPVDGRERPTSRGRWWERLILAIARASGPIEVRGDGQQVTYLLFDYDGHAEMIAREDAGSGAIEDDRRIDDPRVLRVPWGD